MTKAALSAKKAFVLSHWNFISSGDPPKQNKERPFCGLWFPFLRITQSSVVWFGSLCLYGHSSIQILLLKIYLIISEFIKTLWSLVRVVAKMTLSFQAEGQEKQSQSSSDYTYHALLQLTQTHNIFWPDPVLPAAATDGKASLTLRVCVWVWGPLSVHFTSRQVMCTSWQLRPKI